MDNTEKPKKTPAEYKREWYLRNREKCRAKERERRLANRDKIRRYNKEYKQRRKEKLRENKVRAMRMLRLMDVYSQFVEYCKDKYHSTTVRLYTTNMGRFFDYIELIKEKHLKCCQKYWKEHGRFPKDGEEPALNELKKIKYIFEIDRDFITRYVAYVNTEEISKRTGLLLSQPEKEKRFSALKAFLRFCQRRGYINRDLSKFILIPRREIKVLKRALSVEEMERLLEGPDTNTTLGIRNRTMLELSYSGLRAEELLSLKFEHVDLIDNRVMILNSKGDKDRVVPMTQECIYWMKRWLSRRQEFVQDKEDPKYIFITQGRNPVLRQNLARWLKSYAKKAEILLDVSPHDLRRTTATHLAKNGAPIRQVQALLGHTSLQVTTRYLRLTDEEIKEEYVRTHPSNRRKLHYGPRSDQG